MRIAAAWLRQLFAGLFLVLAAGTHHATALDGFVPAGEQGLTFGEAIAADVALQHVAGHPQAQSGTTVIVPSEADPCGDDMSGGSALPVAAKREAGCAGLPGGNEVRHALAAMFGARAPPARG